MQVEHAVGREDAFDARQKVGLDQAMARVCPGPRIGKVNVHGAAARSGRR